MRCWLHCVAVREIAANRHIRFNRHYTHGTALEHYISYNIDGQHWPPLQREGLTYQNGQWCEDEESIGNVSQAIHKTLIGQRGSRVSDVTAEEKLVRYVVDHVHSLLPHVSHGCGHHYDSHIYKCRICNKKNMLILNTHIYHMVLRNRSWSWVHCFHIQMYQLCEAVPGLGLNGLSRKLIKPWNWHKSIMNLLSSSLLRGIFAQLNPSGSLGPMSWIYVSGGMCQYAGRTVWVHIAHMSTRIVVICMTDESSTKY